MLAFIVVLVSDIRRISDHQVEPFSCFEAEPMKIGIDDVCSIQSDGRSFIGFRLFKFDGSHTLEGSTLFVQAFQKDSISATWLQDVCILTSVYPPL